MRAVAITEPGGPEVLRWQEAPDPVPGPGEVVIDVAASGVNRADLMQRQGFYPPPPGAPPHPGLECSGRIRALGAGVTAWRPGEQVCALLRDRVWPLINAGKVAAVIDRELPMSQAAQAHRVLAGREQFGKILLLPN
jgi:NADPH:quinone reductase-like Zn-dependent oxidoreductase